MKKLQDKEMLTNLITKLDKHSLTLDFVHSIEEMSTGKLPVNTIPHFGTFRCNSFSLSR